MFEKVTSAPADWSGTYLIVYEEEKFAFNGALASLDSVSNYITVNNISDGVIDTTATLEASTFEISKNGSNYNIKSKSGKYIGNNSDSNALTNNTSALSNSISLNADKSVQITGAGKSVLRFNATSGQTRFRYFKSSTYSSQKAICLYKLVTKTI